MFDDFFKNKTVLITGHTGFKGSWLAIWLKELGANVIGYALEPHTVSDNFEVCNLKNEITHLIADVKNYSYLSQVFEIHQPDIVFHLAAQAIVTDSYLDPKATYDINVGGTVNVLECCRLCDSVKIIINVTSDKCYKNQEWDWGYRETDPISGYDPYSSSKGCAELITTAYINSYFNPINYRVHKKVLTSVRAGNVIGGGDWQTDRLIPDSMKSLAKSELISLRNPEAVRPWQFVLEPLWGYLLLASKMAYAPDRYSGAWNFGPKFENSITVKQMVSRIVKTWGEGGWQEVSNKKKPVETNCLRLDTTKAKYHLGWFPVLNINETIDFTIEWYKKYKRVEPYKLCLKQIDKFSKKILQASACKKA